MPFPFFCQLDEMDCGPACLKMVAKFHGKTIALDVLKDWSETTQQGTSLFFLSKAAESLRFKTLGVKISYEQRSAMIRTWILWLVCRVWIHSACCGEYFFGGY